MDAGSTKRSHPGRWVGGAVGALASLGVVLVGLLLGGAGDEGRPFPVVGSLAALGLAGIPIATLVGRALTPAARSGRFRQALLAGVGFGLVAPPLGAVGVLAAAMSQATMSGIPQAAGALVMFLPFALVYSYAAVIATIPAGLAWAIVVYAIPERALRAVAMPGPVSRLGARHALVLAAFAWLLVSLEPYIADATDAFECRGDVLTGAHAWDPAAGGLVVVGTGAGGPGRVLRVERGGVSVIRAPVADVFDGYPTPVAAGPDGRAAWVRRPDGTAWGTAPHLWISDRDGIRSVGRLPADHWSGIAWWEGSWMLRDAAGGIGRVFAGSDGVVRIDPLIVEGRPVGRGEGGEGLWASADGRTIGWVTSRDNGRDGWFVVLENGQTREVRLPHGASGATLDGSGRAIVYRVASGGWRSRPLDGSLDSFVADSRWEDVRVAVDGSVAARSTAVEPGRICIAWQAERAGS